MLSVELCVKYLRSIGVEITDEQVTAWDTTERVHRYLRKIRRPAREGWDYECRNSHEWFRIVQRPRRRKADREASTCPECGERAWVEACRWREAGDGTLTDYRPRSEQWRPLDEGIVP